MRAHAATLREGLDRRPRALRRLGRPLRRAVVAPAIVAVIALAGAWGLAAPRRDDGPPAGIGESIRLDDGSMRVERFGDQDVPMMPMPMSGPGMTEPGSRGKQVHVPHGMRRVGVDIVVRAAAGGSGVRLKWSDFALDVGGGKRLAPVFDDMPRSFIPAGTALAGNLAFNLPLDARELTLHVRGADRPISIAVGAAPPSAHGGHGHH